MKKTFLFCDKNYFVLFGEIYLTLCEISRSYQGLPRTKYKFFVGIGRRRVKL